MTVYDAASQQRHDEKPSYDNNGGSGGGGLGDELTRYPTDFLRDVVPIPCHSHNDYWRTEPLFSALRAGCAGVEADVWFFADHYAETGSLLVGHDTASLTRRRTFASLYVEPLVSLLLDANPRTPFHRGNGRGDADQEEFAYGVFDVDPSRSLVLLVDVKTDGADTWPRVLEQLEPLRSRGWLTHVDADGVVRPRPVTVVATGNAPFDLVAANATYRDAFFDAPLEALWEEEEEGEEEKRDASGRSVAEYNATNSFYASADFRQAVGRVEGGGAGLTDRQLRAIRGQIRGAHRRGLKARYWETPAWPVALRNTIWRVLMDEGADILNVDDLHAASRGIW